MWLAATQGDRDFELARLDHWPNVEVVNDETKQLKAAEGVWRDYYKGQRLENWTKPYYNIDDFADLGETYNCMQAYTDEPWQESWYNYPCKSFDSSCPCSYQGAQPLLRLRGLCSTLIRPLFSPKQLPANPGNMILLGNGNTRIEYNDTSSQWVLTDAKSDVTAVFQATKPSYLLGKHKWTISNDECNEGKPTMLKLTGCKEDEFTCDDGQCIKMKRRCDQVTGK